VGALLQKVIRSHKRIIFNGNGYADAWQKEAAKRGLLNLRETVAALPEVVKPKVIETFARFKVLSERELRARYEVNLENYSKTINIEAQLMVLMANRYILPAVLEYQKRVGQSVVAVKQAGATSKEGRKLLAELVKLVDAFRAQTVALAKALTHTSASAEAHAKYMRDTVIPHCVKLRELGDRLEVITPHELWPLPTYREMLFIK
jgi:glutamine synthetase